MMQKNNLPASQTALADRTFARGVAGDGGREKVF